LYSYRTSLFRRFAAFVDALRIAADEADRSRQVHCRWTVLGPDRVPVRSSCGVEITPVGKPSAMLSGSTT